MLPPVRLATLRPIPLVEEAVGLASRPVGLGYRLRRELGLGGTRDIQLEYRLRRHVVDRLTARAARALDRPARSAYVRVTGSELVVVPSSRGRAVDRAALARRLESLPREVQVPVVPVTPEITDLQAQIGRAKGLRIVRAPTIVSAGGQRAQINRALLLRALDFKNEGGTLEPRIDPRTIDGLLDRRLGHVERPPRSARFRVRGRRVEVIAGRPGRAIDSVAVARSIEDRPGETVSLRTRMVAPPLTTREAEDLGIREVVGEFRTPYACCQPRVTNIRRAAELLDGVIIPAGATFSLNTLLGERTRARGFVAAPQINAGKLEDAVGGGISQVATTLFNAAFLAGLRIVSHTPHEFWIPRYPAGREATISWGGPELVLKNDWPSAILLKVVAADEGITVRLFSSRYGRRVSTETIGFPSEGSAFSVVYTRRVVRGSGGERNERFTWTYRAPPRPD
ncbi:VanW family protein [Miltoncostaea oceani]|uniref:VanW family protein n=1 Tax=Miltoncostaea oceani TaxID=2843216 RepID=UPI001C3D96EC|nr:VanW family protein [Miltoncostaea oceani]